ncbi:MAG: hypothetical protein OXG78_06205 [Chloroflexi bacterium]|nr:hypothetical protein [Chloroflexota bacterium]
MPGNAPFSWHVSNGWIVLSGSVDSLSEIRARALSRCDASGVIAYVSLKADLGDALMDDMAELGAATGYLVDIEEGDNNVIYERLSNAAMIVVEADCPGQKLERLLRHTALHAMKEALNRGALILLEGSAAATAGEFILDSTGGVTGGLGLVKNALIASDILGIAEDKLLRSVRIQLPDKTFLGLAPGSALVLGPDGRIETWGEAQVSISLSDLATNSVDVERDWALE